MCSSPRSAHSWLIASSTSRGNTAPLGLLGEMVTMARVRGVIAAAKRSGSGTTPADTATGVAPARRIAISWLK